LLKGAVVEVVDVEDVGAGTAKAAGTNVALARIAVETTTPKALFTRRGCNNML
jgi:hypothetical protein